MISINLLRKIAHARVIAVIALTLLCLIPFTIPVALLFLLGKRVKRKLDSRFEKK